MKIRKILFLIMLAATVATVPGPGELSVLTGNVKVPLVLAVDAGHGGPDGGAEAADGTREAELNLAIAKAVVTSHGGANHARNKSGDKTGAIFEIFIPIK